jgi:hypothetical protein
VARPGRLVDSPQVSEEECVNRRPSAILVVATLAVTGCSSMAQVPRGEFAAEPVRKGVLVRTTEGEQYSFDQAAISADTLTGTGYQQKTVLSADGQPSVEEIATQVRIPLERIASLSEKRRDWGRTAKWGLGAAGAAAFVIAVGTSSGEDPPAKPGGGRGPGPEL